MAPQKEPHELLLYVLHKLLRETLHYAQLRRGEENEEAEQQQVTINCEDFETR